MRVKPGISIRFLLGFGLGTLALVLLLLSSNNLMDAAAKYYKASLLGSVTGATQPTSMAIEKAVKQHQQFRKNAELEETGSRRGQEGMATMPGLAKLASDINAQAHAAAQPPHYVTNYIAMNG